MATTVAEMTTDELRAMLETLIDRKLAEWLGDPDEGLELKEELRERILRQRQEFAAGQQGRTLEEVSARFGLE
jgi:hypothetical protein